MVIKAQTEEAAEQKPEYQNYEDWIDLGIYKNPSCKTTCVKITNK